jgi:hypothetical protein
MCVTNHALQTCAEVRKTAEEQQQQPNDDVLQDFFFAFVQLNQGRVSSSNIFHRRLFNFSSFAKLSIILQHCRFLTLFEGHLGLMTGGFKQNHRRCIRHAQLVLMDNKLLYLVST